MNKNNKKTVKRGLDCKTEKKKSLRLDLQDKRKNKFHWWPNMIKHKNEANSSNGQNS